MTSNIGGNYLAPSFFKNLEVVNPQSCFESFMGKKLTLSNKNDNDQMVYQFLLHAASAVSQKTHQGNKLHIIKQFHPENIQKLLAIAHDLALQNNQPEKALEFRRQLDEIKKTKNVKSLSAANFFFENNLESAKNNKSYITIFK